MNMNKINNMNYVSKSGLIYLVNVVTFKIKLFNQHNCCIIDLIKHYKMIKLLSLSTYSHMSFHATRLKCFIIAFKFKI